CVCLRCRRPACCIPLSSLLRPPPRPTLFPYTTLFRSPPAPLPLIRRASSTALPLRPPPILRHKVARWRSATGDDPLPEEVQAMRSEEHTSELQSRENLVCRLLLEKKKNNKQHKPKDMR